MTRFIRGLAVSLHDRDRIAFSELDVGLVIKRLYAETPKPNYQITISQFRFKILNDNILATFCPNLSSNLGDYEVTNLNFWNHTAYLTEYL